MTSDTTTAADLTRAALSADDAIEQAEKVGISPTEYAKTKHGVDPSDYDSVRSLREALYPERTAELAETPPSEAARGAAILVKRAAGKSLAQSTREVNAETTTAALSSKERERTASLAESALLSEDAIAVSRNDLDAAEYIREIYDLAPEEYTSEYDLRSAMLDCHDTGVIDRRRATLRKARKERENAELRDQVKREMSERHGAPSSAQLAQDALAGTERGHRMNESDRAPDDYVRDEFGVEPREFDTEADLRAAIDENEE